MNFRVFKQKIFKGKTGLFKSFSVYIFATFFNQSASFLLLPVFTHYLSPADYGILSLINTTVSILTIFIMVGSDGAIRKYYYDLKGKEFARFFSSSFTVSLVAFAIVTLLTLVVSPWVSKWLNVPWKWFVLTPFISFLSILPSILQGQNRIQKKPAAYARFTNSFTVSNLLLGLFFVAILQWGYAGRVISLLMVNLIFTGIAIYLLYKQQFFTRNISKEYIRKSLQYGLPLIPHASSALVLAYSDRIFITRMVNVQELGIYNVAYTLGSTISILVTAFTLAYTPFLFENLKEGKPENYKRIVKVSYLLAGALLLGLFFLVIVAKPIYKYFINYRFADGINYVFWVGLGSVFFGMYRLSAGFIFYYNKTKFLASLALVNVLINLILNYLMIGTYGIIGAAYSTMISYLLMFVLTFIISNTIVKMPWLSILKRNKLS
jgi:O-antigen/teichoic acid export membrane protein